MRFKKNRHRTGTKLWTKSGTSNLTLTQLLLSWFISFPLMFFSFFFLRWFDLEKSFPEVRRIFGQTPKIDHPTRIFVHQIQFTRFSRITITSDVRDDPSVDSIDRGHGHLLRYMFICSLKYLYSGYDLRPFLMSAMTPKGHGLVLVRECVTAWVCGLRSWQSASECTCGWGALPSRTKVYYNLMFISMFFKIFTKFDKNTKWSKFVLIFVQMFIYSTIFSLTI